MAITVKHSSPGLGIQFASAAGYAKGRAQVAHREDSQAHQAGMQSRSQQHQAAMQRSSQENNLALAAQRNQWARENMQINYENQGKAAVRSMILRAKEEDNKMLREGLKLSAAQERERQQLTQSIEMVDKDERYTPSQKDGMREQLMAKYLKIQPTRPVETTKERIKAESFTDEHGVTWHQDPSTGRLTEINKGSLQNESKARMQREKMRVDYQNKRMDYRLKVIDNIMRNALDDDMDWAVKHRIASQMADEEVNKAFPQSIEPAFEGGPSGGHGEVAPGVSEGAAQAQEAEDMEMEQAIDAAISNLYLKGKPGIVSPNKLRKLVSAAKKDPIALAAYHRFIESRK